MHWESKLIRRGTWIMMRFINKCTVQTTIKNMIATMISQAIVWQVQLLFISEFWQRNKANNPGIFHDINRWGMSPTARGNSPTVSAQFLTNFKRTFIKFIYDFFYSKCLYIFICIQLSIRISIKSSVWYRLNVLSCFVSWISQTLEIQENCIEKPFTYYKII